MALRFTVPLRRQEQSCLSWTEVRRNCHLDVVHCTGLLDETYRTTLAEREGFEPPIPVKVCPLSRRIVSTAHAPLRAKNQSLVAKG